ncbi:hypothetical protein BC831DRAFT_470135, partial [Entophlyctis helioformis]
MTTMAFALLLVVLAATVRAQLLPASSLPGSGLGPTTGEWVRGKATHYGPFPSYPPFSEIGYQANDVGVGCSNGQPGGDPRWNAILAQGTVPNPVMNSTVWPVVPTVAVSEAAWGFGNKNRICFQTVRIRNARNTSLELTAHVVDFCPAAGCLWKAEERHRNVDLYGETTFRRLGGVDGVIEIEVVWPAGLVPYANAAVHRMAGCWRLLLLLSPLCACCAV